MSLLYLEKISIVKKLRSFFESLGATEVFTPISRKTCADIISRVPAGKDRYLRNCQESYLRLFTPIYGDVFEIGPSFRPESSIDQTHGIEFMLLEAQFLHKDLDFLIGILESFVTQQRDDFICEKVSISNIIKKNLSVDISSDGEEKLIEVLKLKYPKFQYQQPYELVNHYIANEIEPLSIDKCVFFYEYPVCTLSLARTIEKSKNIIQRFEFFVNGVEVSNGYVYVDKVEEYIQRNKNVNLYTIEEEYLSKKFSDGEIDMDACVIGIGIERLCMALNSCDDIRVFLQENDVF